MNVLNLVGKCVERKINENSTPWNIFIYFINSNVSVLTSIPLIENVNICHSESNTLDYLWWLFQTTHTGLKKSNHERDSVKTAIWDGIELDQVKKKFNHTTIRDGMGLKELIFQNMYVIKSDSSMKWYRTRRVNYPVKKEVQSDIGLEELTTQSKKRFNQR